MMKKLLLSSLCALAASLTLMAQVPTVPSAPNVNKGKYTDYTIQEKGFWWGGELLTGVLASPRSVYGPLQAQVVAGYRFNEFFQLGGGVGIRYYLNNNPYRANKSGVAIPLFVDLRGLIISGQSRTVVPCWSADLGFTVFDGFMFSPMIGLRIGSGERHHFIAGIAYLGQQTILDVEGFGDPLDFRYGFMNGVMLKLAYEF